MIKTEKKYLEKHELDLLVKHSDKLKIKNKLQLFLMLDAGLRASEVISLKYSNFDFRNRTITLKSLKKRDKEKFRTVPLSQRLFRTLSDFITEHPSKNLDNFLFPSSKSETGHVRRESLNHFLNRYVKRIPDLNGMKVYPHMLRHTFATYLRAEGTNMHDVKDALGHSKIITTAIYAQPNHEILRAKIDKVAKEHQKPLVKRLKELFKPKQNQNFVNISVMDGAFLVGRNDEIKQINEAVSKDINIVLTGSAGVGKSHLLEHLTYDKKVLILDDLKMFKKSLINIVMMLLEGDKEEFANLLFANDTDLKAKISKESTVNIAEILVSITQKNEYILQINDSSEISPSVERTLKEKLVEHFTIVTTARQIKVNRSDMFWNFERIEINRLSRHNALAMIYRLCSNLSIQDYTHLKNKIWDTTEGNPRMIFQICDRLGKENTIITNDIINQVCDNYIGKRLREIDMSFFFLAICIIAFVVVWYKTGAERGILRLFRYGLIILLLFGRSFFRNFKKQAL